MDIKVAVVPALIKHSRLLREDITMLSDMGDDLTKICLLTFEGKYINSNYFQKGM